MDSLRAALDELWEIEQRIRASGPVAPVGCWIDTYSPGGRKISYARMRSDCRMWDGKKTRGLGRVGGDLHRDYEARVSRRNALEEIERRAIALQSMIDSPIWEPELSC